MTHLAARGTTLQDVLDAADGCPGADAEAFALTHQAAIAAAQVSPELARPYVARLWFTPWRMSGGAAAEEREARWTARMSRTTYQVDGETYSALELGEGPTVLLVHGWGDSAARVSSFAEPLARQGFRVLAPDLPGHGRNPAVETDVPQWARVLDVLARTHKAHAIVAHSLGGVVATRVACDLDLEALVLLAPAVRLDNVVETFRGMFGLPDAAVVGLRQDIEARFGPDVWDDWRVDVFPVPERLPVLLVQSRDDEQIAVEDGRLLAASLPSSEHVELDGLGHTKLLRDQGVIERVVQFLAQPASG
jgi:pimeloyl-ACP methyl ester carboxylesterase